MKRVFAALVGGCLTIAPFAASMAAVCGKDGTSSATDQVHTSASDHHGSKPISEKLKQERASPYRLGDAILMLTPYEAERQRRCFVLAAYSEARGSTQKGMLAVMWTIVNRVEHPDFPETPCAVIAQKGAFEGMKQGPFRKHLAAIKAGYMPPAIKAAPGANAEALSTIEDLSFQMMFCNRSADPVKGATYFYAPKPQRQLGRGAPSWSRQFVRTARVDEHVFYRDPTSDKAVD